jgi:hypothetical protein
MDLPTLVRYFADFLRQNFHCKKVTIASYVSHASKVLFEGGHISDPNVLQSPRFNLQLAGYKRDDEEIAPKRMTIKIPVTYPVLLEVKSTIIKEFGSICEALVLAYMAAFCLGYALSLRPGEYLRVHPPVPLTHQANSSLAAFWFGDDIFFVTRPELYPKDRIPDAFSVLIDHTKNDHGGNGGPRAVYANPDYNSADPDSICCVRTLFEFLKKYPPLPESPLLSGLGTQVSSSDINKILKITADRLGMDGGRMVPHSIRFGGPQQLEEADEETQMAQGNWRSVQGMKTYTRRSIKHARTVTKMLHAPASCPLSHTLYMYTAGSVEVAHST